MRRLLGLACPSDEPRVSVVYHGPFFHRRYPLPRIVTRALTRHARPKRAHRIDYITRRGAAVSLSPVFGVPVGSISSNSTSSSAHG